MKQSSLVQYRCKAYIGQDCIYDTIKKIEKETFKQMYGGKDLKQLIAEWNILPSKGIKWVYEEIS